MTLRLAGCGNWASWRSRSWRLSENVVRFAILSTEGRANAPISPMTPKTMSNSMSEKPPGSALRRKAKDRASGFAVRTVAIKRKRVQVLALGAVKIRLVPGIEGDGRRVEIRPVPAGFDIRVRGRIDQNLKPFIGAGIATDIEAH